MNTTDSHSHDRTLPVASIIPPSLRIKLMKKRSKKGRAWPRLLS